jgi:hypothetical protein
MVEARVGCAGRASFLWHKPNSVPAFARWRSFISLGFPSAQPSGAGCDYYPRDSSSVSGKSRQATLSLCFVLHHMGFFVRPRLRDTRWALTPPFHPCPAPSSPTPHHFQVSRKNRSDVLILPESGAGWGWMVLCGIFSVTLSVIRDLHPGCPRFHGACCLTVFGLSSGKTSVRPAIARHGADINTE